MEPINQSPDCGPLAALLYDAGSVPGIDDLIEAAANRGDFSVSHAPPSGEGWAEILRDGLTFDLRGLAGGQQVERPFVGQILGVEGGSVADLSTLQICPGPHLAGAERLLPVIRVAVALAESLANIGKPRAICWLPAQNAMAPELFRRAVKPWLEGGPFPAVALASLHRQADCSLKTTGLNYLIGQEFNLAYDGGGSPEHLGRVAVRLIDWLVAHGPVTRRTKAVLAGTGAVLLEAPDATSIIARCV